MGQKVDPRGLRLGVNKDWQSNGMQKVKNILMH